MKKPLSMLFIVVGCLSSGALVAAPFDDFLSETMGEVLIYSGRNGHRSGKGMAPQAVKSRSLVASLAALANARK